MANRFKCLKPTDADNNDNNDTDNSKYRGNRFNKPKQVNSRWQRSKSPEKRNTFTKPSTRNDRGFSKDNRGDNRGDNRNGNRRFDKGGFGKYRYNRGRRGPSVFDNVKKDNLGRPMLANATTSGFDIGLALQKQQKQQKDKKDKKNKKKQQSKEEPKLVLFKKEDVKTEEELKEEAEWNKQMILNMQYEWETESEEEEDDHDPMTPNTDLV